MSVLQRIITVALCSLSSVITRFLPFALFPERRQSTEGETRLPRYVVFLGNALPAAIFGLLVVYCLKDVSVVSGSHGLPELIANGLTALLHLWKRKLLLSVATGTICYMLLVQFVFIV